MEKVYMSIMYSFSHIFRQCKLFCPFFYHILYIYVICTRGLKMFSSKVAESIQYTNIGGQSFRSLRIDSASQFRNFGPKSLVFKLDFHIKMKITMSYRNLIRLKYGESYAQKPTGSFSIYVSARDLWHENEELLKYKLKQIKRARIH